MAGALTAAVRNYWVDSDNWSRKHQRMEPIVSSIIDALVERGIDRSWIRTGREASLPASFGLRDTRWDIVIIKDEIPLGAIEFTAQSGLSAAHNLANRIHEATSRALAVRSSDHNGGLQPQLGLFIMFEQGTNTSVQPRLEAALNQFLDDELYDEVAYTYYSDAGLQEPSEGMSVQRFVDRFSRRLLARAVGPLEEITPNLERCREVIEAARGEKKDYSLERVPKRGGQAEVFPGVHKASGIEIAFKRRLSQWTKAGARMGREIEIARILSAHPHVMPVLDFEAQHHWFIMPLADATAEEQLLHLKEPKHLHRMIKAVASALAEAHRHGWRHRDVKPQNILLLHGRWTLADWGTVRRPRGQTTFAGRTGAYIGTPGFAPPELFAGPHDLSVPATDIYSLGRVAAWALTGEWPQANIPLLPTEEPWRTIVKEATHQEIERRPQSMGEFLAIIDREHNKAGRP
ncbi:MULTISPECIES: protein kinase domain-containing protein [Streptomyces]|uniref:protein kinase domain-containing protein n=1 Tax=Streptomyces TaxID=1883 RepID=UPI00225277E3|nr:MULTISPECIES: PaeR7I family type II restriction endonuclease [Streptomyces]MCX4636893.1 protein kinase [Streptomyces platensis]WSX22273.1 protein kinase [Streptomyces tubercidicus]